ncbi:MAG: molybdopterin molybdotransferase MoeA [Deltaproteobacteria bacterium]
MFVSLEDTVARAAALVRAPRKTRTVLLPDCAGEVLAEDISADRNIPPFPRAAMDGFAVAWTGGEDGTPYRVIGTVTPGTRWSGTCGAGDCIKIMTGAAVPPPFDTVIPVERSQTGKDGFVRFTEKARRGQNIALEGDDARKGQALIPAGTVLFPRHVATLAAVGRWEIPVFERPSVTILPTGSELKEPWEAAEGPMIRNGNAHFVRAALAGLGAREVHYGGIVIDDAASIRNRIREGLSDDFLILSGGVSEGEVDIVPQCLAECGVEKVLHKVAVKPGKPLFIGKGFSGTVVIGLPGNPVAVMVHTAMLVKPLFLKASGAREFLPKPIYLPLAAEASNRSVGKKFTPARVVSKGGKSVVAEVPSNGSGDFISALRAEGVFEIPAGVSRLSPGDLVGFHPVWGDLLREEEG